ncbi:uncharacterized protein LOC108477629 [Gossypium arboreum]|uniref:uncharacterized protein LOC108477629 n=1 Tax=Gossypium arboreum TaxID=29729 RepID=UPI00081912C1|nr:uncharacterized protein LOC108477629 [Gossypium arboreum]
MEMKMIDATSGRALVNMTPQRARELISTMVANSQQFRPITEPTRQVHGLNSLSVEDKIDKFTNVVQNLLSDKINPTQLCEICAKPDHPTDSCPILQEDLVEQANAVGNFLRPPQRLYDPYSNLYNVGWKDHPNLSDGTNLRFNQPFQQRPPQNQQIPPPKSSLEAIVERLANSTEKFQQKTDMHLQELDKQVSKLALTVSRLESQGKLSSQTKPNSRHNVSAMTLKSGKVLEPVHDTSRATTLVKIGRNLAQRLQWSRHHKIHLQYHLRFPDDLSNIPQYAKFLKDLCTSKRKLLGNEKVNVEENVSAVLQRKILPKYKDQGVIIQLADRSVVHPEGVLEDVFVKVNELIFLVDFYMIDMEDDN